MVPCLRFRPLSSVFVVVIFVALALPPSVERSAAASSDQARWKDGELLAPLPVDPSAQAAAIAKAVAFGASRGQPLAGIKTVTYASSPMPAPVVYPQRSTPPASAPVVNDPDPARVRWLADLRERLREGEQRLAAQNTGAPEAGSASDAVELVPSSIAAASPSFDGIDDTGWDPADPDIAVGPNHILLATTDRLAITDKCGNTLYTNLIQPFLGLSASRVYYTPKVLYDSWSQHFLMICAGTAPDYSSSTLIVAYSVTSDPLGAWIYYSIDVVFLDGLKDAPSAAVTPSQLYVTYNQFNLTTFAYERVVMLELIKSEVYAGGFISLNTKLAMTNPHDASLAISVQPAQMRTYAGEMYFINSAPFGANYFTLWKLVGPPGASVLTGYDVAAAPYATPPDMVQPNATTVEAGDCRFQDAAYASGKLYASFTRNNAGSPTVQLMQFDVVTLASSGIFIGGGDDYAYPSLDVDENNQIAFAFDVTGPARFLSVAYDIFTFPLSTLASGVLATGSANFAAGLQPYRWGHYTGIDLDPSDGRTFWVQGTYASNAPANSWTTRVGAVTAFPQSDLAVVPLTTGQVSGYEGGPFSPSQIDFQLVNAGSTVASWTLTGVPGWLDPEATSGSLDPGGIETISLFVSPVADGFGFGTYGAMLHFANCTGTGLADMPVELQISVDGSCPGARLTLAPPLAPAGSAGSPPSIEVGAFVTAMEDFTVCAVGIEAELPIAANMSVRIYAADGTTRLAPIATRFWTSIGAGSVMHFIPLEATLEACKEYDVAVTFDTEATWPYWDDTTPGLLPGDVGGLVRVRDAEVLGDHTANLLPRIVLVTDGGTCAHTTDLAAGAGDGFEFTSGTAQGLYVNPERTLRLCSVAFYADVTPGTTLTARVWGAIGGARTALLAEGTAIVTSPLFSFHEVPVSQVLVAGTQYDIEVQIEGSGGWYSYASPPVILPYSVDNTMQVYAGESGGALVALLPRLRLSWAEVSAGAPFDLAKLGDAAVPPFNSAGALSHGAFVTSLIDQEVYSLGVSADIPKGGFVTAWLYEATGTTRGALVAAGTVVSDGPGTHWHDIPLAASLTAGGEYDIMFSAPGVTGWRYWLDTTGLPYDSYGIMRVRDAESGGVTGTGFLAHMRMHACDAVLTAVGNRPQRAPMWLAPPAPNPATGVVRFGYSIDEAGDVDVAVYDASGRRVADVARDRAGVGASAVDFDTRKLPSGVYFVRLTTKTKSTSRKFVVMH